MPSLTQKILHPSAEAKHPDHNDEVWLMDNTAFRSAPTTQDWKAEFVAAFFKDNEDIRKKITIALADLAQALKLAPNDDATETRLRERIAPFLRQIGPNMEVDVQYRDGTNGKLHLGPSESNGIYSAVVPLPSGTNALQASPGESWAMNVVHEQRESPAENSPTAHLETGRTFFAEDGGWGVISDIDDTIKVTEVRDRIKLLKHTFVDLPTAVQGMPDLYKGLRDALSTASHPAPFMYLSASPYNLYPFLRGFVREAGFPGGTIILREMSWMDMESFVMSLTKGTQEYKTDRMKKISSWLPRTTWVCIGDSTQTDPEAYAEFYTYCQKQGLGGRVARIWIHKVIGVNPSKEKDLNDPKRFEKAFEKVPKDVWRTFESAQELYSEFEALKREVKPSQ